MNEQLGSIQDFCSRIEQDSEKEISSILERAEFTAKARAEQILKDTDRKCVEMFEKAEEESVTVRRIILSDLNLELKKISLRIRGEIIEDAMTMLREKISGYSSSPDYPNFLMKLALEGIGVLDASEVVLKAGDTDKDILTEKLLMQIRSRAKEHFGREIDITLDKETIKGQAGLRIISGAGNMLFDNTIEARLHRMGDDLRLLIARNIFG